MNIDNTTTAKKHAIIECLFISCFFLLPCTSHLIVTHYFPFLLNNSSLLKPFINLESEHKIRNKLDEVTDVETIFLPLTFKSENSNSVNGVEVRRIAVARILNLADFTLNYVTRLEV